MADFPRQRRRNTQNHVICEETKPMLHRVSKNMVCRHSGFAGDILYALPAMRALGARTLLIRANSTFPSAAVPTLLPLLRAQPYLDRAEEWNGEPIDLDFDKFHDLPTDRLTIADAHLLTSALPLTERDRAWLTAFPQKSAVLDKRTCSESL